MHHADHDTDLNLLRRFEPVLRYTQGELFLPSSVADYVSGSSLLRAQGKGDAEVLAQPADLTLDGLADVGRARSGERVYLTFVDEPLDRRAFSQWRKDPQRPRFIPSSRFAAVGIMSRLLDSLLRLTLVLRGKVPGGFAAAAALRMRAMPRAAEHPYYGHVTRDGGYIVLQYWYFYAMNDWRSTFGGVNDHEADWEQVTVFLVDRGDEPPEPAWVAFSSHDEVGDDLRRRWDDPDIEFVGEHPVVYAGAGSHSGAYVPGEYIVTVPVPLPGFVDRTRKAFLRVLPWANPDDSGMWIPYIDYRRGDGPGVGAGQALDWSPVVIDDDTPWVRDYRGLWGLDTKDPLGGERAPAGPRYDRHGTVRESWGQPVAWAGLDKEAPTKVDARVALTELLEAQAAELAQVDADLEEARTRLRGGRAADRAAGRPARRPSRATRTLQDEVAQLRARQDAMTGQIEAIDRGLAGAIPADGVHDHLKHRALPLEDSGATSGKRGRLLRIWSAASASILLATIGVILILPQVPFLEPVLILFGVMVLVEAALRGRFMTLLGTLLIVGLVILAVVVVVGLIVGQFRLSVGILLAFAALYMLWQTIREGLRTR